MSDELLKDAACYPAPVVANGEVIVADSATSASSAVQVVDVSGGDKLEYWDFEADGADFYLTFGDSGVADPSQTATSGTSRSIKLAAGVTKQFMFCRGRSHFKHLALATGGWLRANKASRGRPDSFGNL